jgi:hypothetical protein
LPPHDPVIRPAGRGRNDPDAFLTRASSNLTAI